MTQQANALIYSLTEMFSSSSQRYMDTLAPLMPKRDASETASKTSAAHRVRVFHRAAA